MRNDSSGRGSRADEPRWRSPEAVEHDIERDWGGDPGVQQNDDLKNAERLPRRGDETDKPFRDAYDE